MICRYSNQFLQDGNAGTVWCGSFHTSHSSSPAGSQSPAFGGSFCEAVAVVNVQFPLDPLAMSSNAAHIPAHYRARALLRTCQALVQRLLEASAGLITQRTSPQTSLHPRQLVSKLVETQEALRAVVDELVEHQELNASLEALRAAVAREDAKIGQLTAVLRGAEAALQDSVDGAAPRMAALERAGKRAVDVADVISYGGRIGPSLAAPPGWEPGAAAGNVLPPAPPEEMMRAGKLAALTNQEHAEGGEGVLETREAAVEEKLAQQPVA